MRSIVLLATGLALGALSVPASSQTKVAIGYSGWTGFAPLTLAKEAGIFKKHGLDVDMKKIPQKDRHLAIASGDHVVARAALAAAPLLATAGLARGDEFFIAVCHAQVYQGDTALHAAAFAYDVDIARDLISLGADIRARNRRGAEPLHAAVIGEPGSTNWNPGRQRAIIRYLIKSGADPNARAIGGVTPLHRAVNRTVMKRKCPRISPSSTTSWPRHRPAPHRFDGH